MLTAEVTCKWQSRTRVQFCILYAFSTITTPSCSFPDPSPPSLFSQLLTLPQEFLFPYNTPKDIPKSTLAYYHYTTERLPKNKRSSVKIFFSKNERRTLKCDKPESERVLKREAGFYLLEFSLPDCFLCGRYTKKLGQSETLLVRFNLLKPAI